MNRAELKAAEAKGLASVKTETLHSIFDNMDKYLDGNPAQPNALVIEKFRSDVSGSLAYQEHLNVRNLEIFRQVNAVGQSALKSVMLVNGGAAVALLAFLGNVLSSNSTKGLVLPFANSMRGFVFGVFLSAVAFALTYLGQLSYSGNSSWSQRCGATLNVLTSLVGASALLAFLWGANAAYGGFIAFAP